MSDKNLLLDLRKEAEERASLTEVSALSSSSLDQNNYTSRPSSVRIRSSRLHPVINLEPTENLTPHIAKIAEKDYLLNGSRARAESGDFIPPRWIPDLATNQCTNCRCDFDWINRRHHCRHCGQIFCENCASQSLLLPPEFGYRDPERICLRCYDQLLPLQGYFSTNIANHQRANTVDIASDTCNVRRHCNMPIATTLGSEIRKAAYTMYNLLAPQTIRDKAIPLRLIREAKGLAFLTIFKGGFGVGAKFGTGLVIARLPKEQGGGWSAPSAIGVMGFTWGFMIGADLTDTLIVLNTDDAVRAFAGNAQLTIGADIEIAVGLVGRSGSAEVHLADTQTLAPAFSYSQSKGFYAGVSLDGSVLVTRSDVNHKFYGRPVEAQQLLSGELPSPRAAAPLYNALAEAFCALPDVSHRPPSTTASPSALRDHRLRHSSSSHPQNHDTNNTTNTHNSNVNNNNVNNSMNNSSYKVVPPVPPSQTYQPPAANYNNSTTPYNAINNNYSNNTQGVSQYSVQQASDGHSNSSNNYHQHSTTMNNSTNEFSFAEFFASFFGEMNTTNFTHGNTNNVNATGTAVHNDNNLIRSQYGYAGYEGYVPNTTTTAEEDIHMNAYSNQTYINTSHTNTNETYYMYGSGMSNHYASHMDQSQHNHQHDASSSSHFQEFHTHST